MQQQKPACPCHSDPARRHGPNLYFTWRSVRQDFFQSLYVPADRADQAKAAAGRLEPLLGDWLSDRSAQSGTVAEAVDKAQTKGNAESNVVIQHRRLHTSAAFVADGLIMAEQIGDLWEPWMRQIDDSLNDEALLDLVQDALAKRCTKSKTRGRPATPAEVVLRVLLLCGEAHAQLELPGVGSGSARQSGVSRVHADRQEARFPTTRPWDGWDGNSGPEVIQKVHGERVVAIAQEKKVVSGRKMRVDTTVVEDPTHSLSNRQQPIGRWDARADQG